MTNQFQFIPMTERTPSTRAGREFLDSIVDLVNGEWPGDVTEPYTEAIYLIEAEARADALREVGELRAALETLARACRDDSGTCRLCRAPASNFHEDDCAVNVAVDRLYPRWGELRPEVERRLAQPPAPDPQQEKP